MKITVCIGSSCHLKGSRQIIEELQYLIAQNNITEHVELAGAFCLNNCQKGVCVSVGKIVHSVTPETTRVFFEKNILTKLCEQGVKIHA